MEKKILKIKNRALVRNSASLQMTWCVCVYLYEPDRLLCLSAIDWSSSCDSWPHLFLLLLSKRHGQTDSRSRGSEFRLQRGSDQWYSSVLHALCRSQKKILIQQQKECQKKLWYLLANLSHDFDLISSNPKFHKLTKSEQLLWHQQNDPVHFWLVLKLEISYNRVLIIIIISWRIYFGFFI